MPKIQNKLIFLILFTLFIFASIQISAQSGSKVVAVVNGRTITQTDVDDSIIGKILPLQEQINILRKAALENLITKTILEQEARKKGVSIEQLRKALTVGKVEILSGEVDKAYLENASAFASMSPDEAKERLRLDMENQERMRMYREAVQKLKTQVKIELHSLEFSAPEVVVNNEGPAIGDKNASITIVEFSDFQCPYCREAFKINKQILQAHGNDVKLIFKHLPLHSRSLPAARASFCADKQNRFWEYHDNLFAAEDFSDENLNKIAEKIGLNLSNFKNCVVSEDSRSAVSKDIQEAQRLGIDGTPSFFVNNELVKGVISFEDFNRIIESKLKERR